MTRKSKPFRLENAYFAVDATDFVITPGEVVRMRIQGKLIMGCLDLWAVIYYLNYGREPISYKVLMQHLQCSKAYLRRMIKSLEDNGCLRIEEYQGKLLYRLISKQVISSPDEPRGLCSEPPSLSDEPRGLCSEPPSLSDEPRGLCSEPPQFTERTALSSIHGNKIKSHENDRDFLRNAPEPREVLQPAAKTKQTATPQKSHISIDSELRSAPHAPETKAELAAQLEQDRAFARQELLNAGFSAVTVEQLLQRYHPARLLSSLSLPESPLCVREIQEHLRKCAGTLPAQGI